MNRIVLMLALLSIGVYTQCPGTVVVGINVFDNCFIHCPSLSPDEGFPKTYCYWDGTKLTQRKDQSFCVNPTLNANNYVKVNSVTGEIRSTCCQTQVLQATRTGCMDCQSVSDCPSNKQHQCIQGKCQKICPDSSRIENGGCVIGVEASRAQIVLEVLPPRQQLECITDFNCPSGEICLSNNRCGECLVDSQCLAGEFCKLPDFTCVECLIDSNCPSGDFCLSNDRCGECLVDAQCQAGKLCKQDFTCVECLTDSNCPSGEFCLTNDQCGECLVDAQCLAGEFCKLPDFACVECLISSNCPSGEICLSNDRCGECLVDAQCLAGEFCKLPDFTCVECLIDSNCPSGEFCFSDNRCGQCQNDLGCTSPQICNTQIRKCLECVDYSECGEDYFNCQSGGVDQCDRNYCLDRAGNVCNGNVCTACANDNQCRIGFTQCNELTGQCSVTQPLSCSQNTDCLPFGKYCETNVCTQPAMLVSMIGASPTNIDFGSDILIVQPDNSRISYQNTGGIGTLVSQNSNQYYFIKQADLTVGIYKVGIQVIRNANPYVAMRVVAGSFNQVLYFTLEDDDTVIFHLQITVAVDPSNPSAFTFVTACINQRIDISLF